MNLAKERIVAVGLLTQRDVDALGSNFRRLWPINEAPCFSQLLRAIDEADRELWRERDASMEGTLQALEVSDTMPVSK